MPKISIALSWVDAQKSCEAENSSLVSVNSDAEWHILVTSGVFAWDNVGICYLGALTEVNKCSSTCKVVNKYITLITLLNHFRVCGM